MPVREILVNWTTQSGPGKVSVFNFDASAPVAGQRNALNDFLEAADAILHQSSIWTIALSGREFDENTGELVGSWAEAFPFTGAGDITAGGPEADAVQALVRWETGSILGGRFLKGRTFLPGVAQGALTAGNLSSGSVAALTAAAVAFAASGDSPVIWRRPHTASAADPRPSYSGDMRPITSGLGWSELAVLRRRRG